MKLTSFAAWALLCAIAASSLAETDARCSMKQKSECHRCELKCRQGMQKCMTGDGDSTQCYSVHDTCVNECEFCPCD